MITITIEQRLRTLRFFGFRAGQFMIGMEITQLTASNEIQIWVGYNKQIIYGGDGCADTGR